MPQLSIDSMIPSLTAAVAIVLAGLSLTRGRANRIVALMLLSAAFWSLCEAGWTFTRDPATAMRLACWAGVGPMLIGPLALQLMLTLQPKLEDRFARGVPITYAASVASIVAGFLPGVLIEGVERTPIGWVPVFGPGMPLAFVGGAAIPVAAAWSWFRLDAGPTASRRNSPWLELAVGIPLLTASMTNFVLPLFEIYVPRLGAASLVAWGGVSWWSASGFRPRWLRDRGLTPREFAREILETLPDGLILLRADARIRGANETLAEMVGWPADRLLGRPVADVLTRTPGPDAVDLESELLCADGSRVPVSLSSVELHHAQDEPIGRVLVVRDMREITSLRSRLVTAGRLAAVGQLASGIAHEINNPIAYVRSGVGHLRRHWEHVRGEFDKTPRNVLLRAVFEDGDELLAETAEGIERIASIVRDVGGLRNVGDGAEPEVADVHALLDSALRVAAAPRRAHIAIERDYGEIPSVRARSRELMQVFVNLLLNACHALDEGGTIRLTTRPADGGALVRIEDDGPGIRSPDLERIFEPFFTTKPVGVGTGLGLAISKQIIENHAGRIGVRSQPGRGSCFEIWLPSVGSPIGESPT